MVYGDRGAVMSRFRPETIIEHYRGIGLLGLLLLFLNLVSDGFGVITGSMLVMLGSMGGCFRDYRRESGLWMLSGFYLVFVGLLLAFFAYGTADEILRYGLSRLLSEMGSDYAAATLVLMGEAAFLLTVTRTNWRLKKKTERPEL
jgi:hypothetical protein